MKKILIKLSIILGILILSINIIYSTNNGNNNENKKNNLVLKDKYSGKKLDRITNSVKGKKEYRLLIETNDTFEEVKEYFTLGENNAKIKKLGNNKYMVRLPLNTQFLLDDLSQIDNGILPSSLGKYDIIEPEIVESLVSDYVLGEETDKLWGLNKIGASEFQEDLQSKEKIKVGVLDTGISYNNEDLDNNYYPSLSYDFINNETDAIDDNGHGTQVAGTIGAEVNGKGVFGVNSNTDLISLKVLDSNGLGTSYDILEAIDYAVINNIKVLNMSFGGIGTPLNNPICESITNARNNGLIIITSAGNNNSEITNSIPASCDNTITVGATDSNNNKASFSNYGTGVTIFAPGVNIYTTSLNNIYKEVNGTSFGAAFVTGLVAKELAFSGGISYEELVNNINNNYGLSSQVVVNTTETNTGTYTLPENLFLFDRFLDFRFLSIDNEYVYYSDIKNQDKIYKIRLNSQFIGLPQDYYTQNSQFVFSNKMRLNPFFFNSGVYINLSEYPNQELVSQFLNTGSQDRFLSSETISQSLGKYDINFKFDQIMGKKFIDIPGFAAYQELGYLYYRNNNDYNKIYRVKMDGSDINPEGIKLSNLENVNFAMGNGEYIYYNNHNDNYKLYRAKKDGSEGNTIGTKVIDIDNSRSFYEDGEYIYYNNPNDNYKTYRIKSDGTESTTGGTKIINMDYSFVYHYEGDYLYYLNANDSNKLYRIKNDGTETTTGGIKISDTISFMYLLSDNQYIYYYNRDINGGYFRVKKDGSESDSIGTKIMNIPDGGFFMFNFNFNFINDGEYLYYTDMANEDKIYRIKKDGSEIDIGSTQINSARYNNILFIEGDYIYYTSREYNPKMYRIKKDGTEFNSLGTKINDIFASYITHDTDYIYYCNYDYQTGGISGYKYYKVKKDGTDQHLSLEGGVYTSPEITLELNLNFIKINVDSVLPTGTNYKFYLSKDNYNFIEIDKNKLAGTTNIDLGALFGLNSTQKIYYKVELYGNQNDQTVTPIIKSVELFRGESVAREVKSISVTGGSSCSRPYYNARVELFSENGQSLYSNIQYNNTTDPSGCSAGSWLWGSKYLGNSCHLVNVTSDLNNYYVNYSCNAYYGMTSGAANGSGYQRSLVWGGSFTLSKTNYDLCKYNQEFCTTPPLAPTNLKQYVQSPSPELEREEFGSGTEIGKKIGKYQSGSGIILSADMYSNDTGKQLKFAFEIYKYSSTLPLDVQYATGIIIGSKEIVLPYYGSGSYYWRVRTEDDLGNASDWVNFGTDNQFETDYELFEGFEPYPYGYKFPNASPSALLFDNILTGGINYIHTPMIYPFVIRLKIPGNKWDIFETAFDTSSFNNDENKIMDAFEILPNLGGRFDAFQGGNCYGMALSAAMQYTYPEFMKKDFPIFSQKIGTGTIRSKIDNLSLNGANKWNVYDDTVKAILTLQLSQYSIHQTKKRINYTGALNIYDTLEKYPNNTYLLNIKGKKDNGLFPDVDTGHSVIPYKVETTTNGLKRIYFWDNNVQFPKKENDLAYDQYIEITSTGYWFAPYYDSRTLFDKISLVSLDDIYHGGKKSAPIGFNINDSLFALNGTSDIIVTDLLGRTSGFSGGTILEEIPGVNVILPLNDTLDGEPSENTWKQIYLSQKQDLTVKVIAKGQENYDLMIAGGDYYTKLEDVETSTGQIDTFESKVDNLKIDFDDIKTGDYNLLTDNFQENNTGTVYIDQAPVITSKQEYNIDWLKVKTNELDSITQRIDINNDGINNGTGDTIITLPPIFQDLLAPNTTVSFSGTHTPNTTNNSYIETTTITLSGTDNEGGSGIDKTYYSLDNTGTIDKVYLEYITPITINGVNQYTITYYSIDQFGNKEESKIVDFSLTELPETYQGEISGYVYEDLNNNGVKDSIEKTMAGWKICIDINNNNDCEENNEPFNVTNNQGYYEFNGLASGTYKILEIPHQNWFLTNPNTSYYNIVLNNGQKVINKNYGNLKTKVK